MSKFPSLDGNEGYEACGDEVRGSGKFAVLPNAPLRPLWGHLSPKGRGKGCGYRPLYLPRKKKKSPPVNKKG